MEITGKNSLIPLIKVMTVTILIFMSLMLVWQHL